MLPRQLHHKGFKQRKPMSRGKAKLAREGNYGGIKRNYSKRLGTAKPKEGSRRDLEHRLESLLAKRVKMRDGYQCRQCAFDGAPTMGLLDAGHIYPKGKFPGGKFLVENIVAQCRAHNTRHIDRPEFMFLWYEAEHGEGSLARLHAEVLAMPRKMSIEWLTQAIWECEEAIAEMELLAA
jgi:hypothetical protein